MTPVEVSLWAQAITSTSASALGRGRVAGLGLDHDRVAEERRRRGRLGELLRELAVGEVERALADEPGAWPTPRRRWCRRCRARPRSRRAARRARRGRSRMPRDEVADRRLAVRGAHQRGALGQRGKRLRADLRGSAAEAAVGRLQRRPGSGWCQSSAAPSGDRLLTDAGGPVPARPRPVLTPRPRLRWPVRLPAGSSNQEVDRCIQSATKRISSRRRTGSRPSSA